jgi:hypothetical protein
VGQLGAPPQRPLPRGALATFDPLRLKLEPPSWGLDVLLLASLQGKRVPSRTALCNYLRCYYPRFRVTYRGRANRPNSQPRDLTDVHQRWQMDFKGKVTIEPEGQVAPFLVRL